MRWDETVEKKNFLNLKVSVRTRESEVHGRNPG